MPSLRRLAVTITGPPTMESRPPERQRPRRRLFLWSWSTSSETVDKKQPPEPRSASTLTVSTLSARSTLSAPSSDIFASTAPPVPALKPSSYCCSAAPPGPHYGPISHILTKNSHSELGYMEFQHDSMEDALMVANTDCHRPVFYVQASLPGDVDLGQAVFSHPLIVEAASSMFITVFCSNMDRTRCAGRRCRTSLDILDDAGHELVTTLCSESLTRASVVESMTTALEAYHQPIPKYLMLLRDEEMGRVAMGPAGPRTKEWRSVFGMADSAEAECEFAGLDGVLSTRAGWIDAQRVVEVAFDSKRLSYCCLVRYALKRKIADVIYYQSNDERVAAQVELERVQENSIVASFSGSVQPDHDPKRALRKTPLRFVPLTELQSTRANRLVHGGRFNEAMHLLSPRQGLILMQAMKGAAKTFHEVVDVPILPAWLSVCEKQDPKQTLAALDEANRVDLRTPNEYNMITI